jgi:hypothetical protein
MHNLQQSPTTWVWGDEDEQQPEPLTRQEKEEILRILYPEKYPHLVRSIFDEWEPSLQEGEWLI